MTWPLFSPPRENTYWVYRENIFSDSELDRIVELGNQAGLISGGVGGNTRSEYRNSDIAWLGTDDPEHDWIYATLAPVVNEVNQAYFQFDLKEILPLQFTCYRAENNGVYRPHLDIGRDVPNRKLSFSLQLTDPVTHTGGELRFLHLRTEPDVAPKARGKIIFFPSWVVHEVTPVTQGTRHSLVGWVAGPNFR